ncbi:hypothetical protein [Bellilinea sp.]
MKSFTDNLSQQLKQAVIKQKSSHLEQIDEKSNLYTLYRFLYLYEEHVSKLVFQALQQRGEFTPFAMMDSLESEIQKSDNQSDPDLQRIFNHYRAYKQRLDEIYRLVKVILTSKKNGEKTNDG